MVVVMLMFVTMIILTIFVNVSVVWLLIIVLVCMTVISVMLNVLAWIGGELMRDWIVNLILVGFYMLLFIMVIVALSLEVIGG